jgi:hypothetical protein
MGEIELPGDNGSVSDVFCNAGYDGNPATGLRMWLRKCAQLENWTRKSKKAMLFQGLLALRNHLPM